MTGGIFVTGTDTGIGKTRATVMLMNALKAQGYSVAGMKPVASGATIKNGQLRNDDATLIQEHCSSKIDYELINPVVFESPIAPHIAAIKAGTPIDINKIKAAYDTLKNSNDIVVVEGVGGWRVPLSETLSLKDLVRELKLPVVMVIGLRLGCLNHAILTADAILADGLTLCAWISNRIDKTYENVRETLQTLRANIPAPGIAEIPYLQAFERSDAEVKIDLSAISRHVPILKQA